MTNTAIPRSRAPAADLPADRFDLYAHVHKGLRACMAATLVDLGRVDCDDDPELKRVLDDLDQLLDWCAGHLAKEDHFVDPAIAARDPATGQRTAGEHAEHRAAIARLRAGAEALARCNGAPRAAAAARLYRQVALFIGENLVHMEAEESRNNAILWAGHSDAELAEMHAAIVAATTPVELARDVRWVTPHLRPAELATLVGGLQASMPPEVFDGLVAMMRPHLSAPAWRRLAGGLGLAAAASVDDTPAALAERFIDAAFVRFDAEAAASLVSPDFIAHPWAAFGLPPGPACLRAVVPLFGHAFAEAKATVLDTLVDDDRVALRYAYAARHVGELFGIAAIGRSFRIEGLCILRMAGGRVAEFWREEDMLGLQRQLGVPTLLPAPAGTD